MQERAHDDAPVASLSNSIVVCRSCFPPIPVSACASPGPKAERRSAVTCRSTVSTAVVFPQPAGPDTHKKRRPFDEPSFDLFHGRPGVFQIMRDNALGK